MKRKAQKIVHKIKGCTTLKVYILFAFNNYVVKQQQSFQILFFAKFLLQ